ncbi:TA system VapC family ribonuclease toxin [Solicola gregarius]|uniref:Ribonuclease VapC n=1 Tax=Solicola gregarius TaxID=2908642 RepID=A0AA46TIX9_9ACTN|nr:TA system VapC family ribonuclease toxin [Solicola gregarius]UYM05702.1 PIN domain-containing protein [Solicola gregarius]
MTATYLLDANVLIALTVAEHEHHARSSAWAAGVDSFAVCPIVEGALVRFLVRIGERSSAAQQVIRGVHARAGCAFWADEMSYADAHLDEARGHREVTDAYLLSLALEKGATLATLDRALAAKAPTGALLVPEA